MHFFLIRSSLSFTLTYYYLVHNVSYELSEAECICYVSLPSLASGYWLATCVFDAYLKVKFIINIIFIYAQKHK